MLNQLKTVLLLSVLTAIMLGFGLLIGGTSGLSIAFVLVLFMNLITYFFSDKIVLFMYNAREAPKTDYPKLHKIVEQVAHLAGIPKPRVYIIPTQTPNAFATGRNPKNAVVACTEGILSLLNEHELKGVIGHEIGHVINRDILITTIAATVAAVISYVASMFRYMAIFGSSGRDRENNFGGMIGLLLLSILAPLIAVLLQLAISRTREFYADETGARLVKDPNALASALQKLHAGIQQHPLKNASPAITATSSLFIMNPFSAGFIVSLFSTHPSTEERVKRLREMKV